MKNSPSSYRSGVSFLLVVIIGGALLVGCSSVEERQANSAHLLGSVAESASGTVTTVMDYVLGAFDISKLLFNEAKEEAANLEDRVNNVKDGIDKIQEGKKLIEEGLGNGKEAEEVIE